MRPVTPSRRYEKNRDASVTVHQAPPLTLRHTRRRQPIACQTGQVGVPLGAAFGLEAADAPSMRPGAAPNAISTSSPTSNASGPMQAPSQATTSLRRAPARPRRAHRRRARRRPPPGRASRRARRRRAPPCRRRQQHRQAVGRLDDASDARLAGDDGVGLVDRRARRCIGDADADDARAVDLAQEDRRCARRLARGAPGWRRRRRHRRRRRRRRSSSRTARVLTPPDRVVISAPTPATRQSGASQSARPLTWRRGRPRAASTRTPARPCTPRRRASPSARGRAGSPCAWR